MGGRGGGGGVHPAGGISTLMQMLVFWCWMCNQESVCQHAADNNSALFRGAGAAKIQLTQI